MHAFIFSNHLNNKYKKQRNFFYVKKLTIVTPRNLQHSNENTKS
jgi:hypothetical protein